MIGKLLSFWLVENWFLKIFFVQVALITLGKVVESTGYVVQPYYQSPQLLNILLSFLKTEPSLAFRKEVSIKYCNIA